MIDGTLTLLAREIPGYLASFGLGCLLGSLFLWGLWLTVQRIPSSRHPAALILGSLVLRFGLTLAGFYLVARYGHWEHILITATGFTLPRLLANQRIQAGLAVRNNSGNTSP